MHTSARRACRALAAGALLTACSACAPCTPDVVLVVLDTTRADHLDLYGYPHETAPFLRSLAGESVVFRDAFSTSSSTAPATASLLTGEYVVRHGVEIGFFAHKSLQERLERQDRVVLPVNRIADSVPTLAERLQERGYDTFGVSSNMNIGSEIGFDRGFRRFARRPKASAEEIVDGPLREWIDEIRAAPAFVYLHLNDAHGPFYRRAPWYREQADPQDDTRARYDSEIRYMDEQLKRAFELLDPEGRAIVVVASDHGEEFWERGQLGHFFSLHVELNRVVLMIRAPGVEPGLLAGNVSLVDVVPTVLELVDAAPAADFAGAGVSLAPLLRGADPATLGLEERLVFAQRNDFYQPKRTLWAAVRGRWKLIEGPRRRSLFDRASDPAERSDLAQEHAERAAELSRALERHRSVEPAPTATGTVTLDGEGLEQLRELGYVEE